MVKTYSFLSGFVLRLMIGNSLASALLILFSPYGSGTAVYLNMFTIYIGAVWVLLKLLQASFPEKVIKIPYTETTRRKQSIGMIISAVVCVVLIVLNALGYFNDNQPSVVSVSLPFMNDYRVPTLLAPLTFLPVVVVILLVNIYVGWFYRLAGQRRLPPQEEQPKENN